MKDISCRNDIELLIDKFYEKVLKDNVIGQFFNEVVNLDWHVHIPIMYDFWETTLLGKANYKGNPMVKHIQLNQKEALEQKHFERWLHLWENTIKLHFKGPKANEAINKAHQISGLMQFKIAQHSDS